MPAGWQIADGSADDARVCGAHPWQSCFLVLANGDRYGTAACDPSSARGNRPFECFSRTNDKNYKNSTALKLKSGERSGIDFLVKDGQWVRTRNTYDDVLLRKKCS